MARAAPPGAAAGPAQGPGVRPVAGAGHCGQAGPQAAASGQLPAERRSREGSRMTTADEVIKGYVEIEARVDKMRDKYASKEGYVSGEDSPWVPFIPNVYIKHLTF